VNNGLSFLVVIVIEVCVVAFFVTGWILWRRREAGRKQPTGETPESGDN
jgi:hypothetical protein